MELKFERRALEASVAITNYVRYVTIEVSRALGDLASQRRTLEGQDAFWSIGGDRRFVSVACQKGQVGPE